MTAYHRQGCVISEYFGRGIFHGRKAYPVREGLHIGFNKSQVPVEPDSVG